MWGFLRALCLMLLPVGALAQTPDGMERLRLLPGAYALDAGAIGAQALIVIARRRPETQQEFLQNFRLCSESARVASALGNAGLRSVASGYAEALRQMRAGRCQIYITRAFDFSALGQAPTGGASGGDDVPSGASNQTGQTGTPPEVPRTDDTPPRIRVLTQPLRTTERRGTVRVQVTDGESAIAAVRMRLWDGRTVEMQGSGDNIYTAQIILPPDYQTETVVVSAQSAAQAAALARVSVARVPHCGPARAVTAQVVRGVQSNLTCLGHDPGPIDGQQGRSTCRGISSYLGAEIEAFNAGQLSWEALNRRLGPECALARPVRLAFETPVRRDADTVRAAIDLNPAGAAARIEIARQGRVVSVQDWQGTAQRHLLDMPGPGQEARYTVEVLDRTGKARDRQTLILQRPAARMRVSPSGRLSQNAETADVTITMDAGASAVRDIEVVSPGTGRRIVAFDQNRARMTLRMPAPGTSEQVRFTARGARGGLLAREFLRLERPAPALPQPNPQSGTPAQPRPGGMPDSAQVIQSGDGVLARGGPGDLAALGAEGLPAIDPKTPPVNPPLLTVSALGGAVTAQEEIVLRIALENPGPTRRIVLIDQGTGLVLVDRLYAGAEMEERVRMPVAGETLDIGVAAQTAAGEAVAESRITLARSVAPAVQVPLWVWAAGLGVFLAGGAIGLKLRKTPEAGTAGAGLIKPHVTVKTDQAPEVSLPTSAIPGVVFWVETQGVPAATIDLPSETEDGA